MSTLSQIFGGFRKCQERVTHHYDSEADVLYISFGDDEPVYTENIDDFLLLDIGWFSGILKGFRILSPTG